MNDWYEHFSREMVAIGCILEQAPNADGSVDIHVPLDRVDDAKLIVAKYAAALRVIEHGADT